MVSVIAHELAHSWSGNLVSNKTWNDFWINEGFTVYFEHRIMEELYGKEIADILALVEIFELDEEIIRIKNSKHPEDSKLLLNLNQRNPDEGMTDIAYVKGAWFLRSLEARAGRKVFDKFLNNYFSSFAFSTISTGDFIDYLKKNLLSKQNIDFNYNEWINQEGLPNNKIDISSPRLTKMKELALKFSNGEDVFAPKIRYERIRIKKKIKKKKIVEQLKKGGAFDEKLYDLLVDLRKSLAKEKNIPPFVIFQEPSLRDMCLQYPITLDELTNIQGVGAGKAQRYGEPFLALIADYVEEHDIERPQDMVVKSLVNKSMLKVQLIQNIDRKLPLEDIASSQGKSFNELLDEIESIVNSGTRVNINYYINSVLDNENQEELYDYFSSAETDDILDAYHEFDGLYSEEELRLMRIKFMSEMAN